MKKLLNFLFSRIVIVGFLLILQLVILVFTIWKLTNYFVYMYVFFSILSIAVVLYIVSKRDNPSYKLAWIIPILTFPIFGGLMYLCFGKNKLPKLFKNKIQQIYTSSVPLLLQDGQTSEELKNIDKSIWNQSKYITDFSNFPIYKNTTTQYLSPGEKKFEVLKQELEKAEHYIFMEYFIIEEGVMWNSILDILVRKVKQGVIVRVMYDDVGCLFTLPYKYNETLEKMGISCAVFNPFRPTLTARMNNRDHRKIAVIDGHTGFTGGINLADEYINEYEKHGHWKDASIMLKGEAVWNLTIMFLQIWNFTKPTDKDYNIYRPHIYHKLSFESDGFVQPYCDSPLDEEIVGENIYLNMIGRAKNYIYINTPYLIVDNEIVTSLCIAAKSSVDVRIVTPYIADKWFVHLVTRSYYSQLIDSGVKIYEYKPGFIHSKTFVCDDETATIGTINLDYRSLYLHFECGIWIYKSKAVMQLKQDFLETLNVCTPITIQYCESIKWHTRLLQSILRLFAPLM